MLELLNEDIIPVQDVQSILMSDNLDKILFTVEDQEAAALNEAGRLVRKNNQTHQMYLKKHQRRENRKDDEEKARAALPIQRAALVEDQEELHVLYKLDQAEHKLRQTREKAENGKVWQQSLNNQHAGVEYNVSIKDHKKMLKDYEEHKKNLEEEKIRRKKAYVQKILASSTKKKRREKAYKESSFFVPGDGDYSLESDSELRRASRLKRNRKPKLNLELGGGTPMGSSDSDVIEGEEEEENLSHQSLSRALSGPHDRRGRSEDSDRELSPLIHSPLKAKRGRSSKLNEVKRQVSNKNVEEAENESNSSSKSRITEEAPKNGEMKNEEAPRDKRRASYIIKERYAPAQKTPKTYAITQDSFPNLSLPIYERNIQTETRENKQESNNFQLTEEVSYEDLDSVSEAGRRTEESRMPRRGQNKSLPALRDGKTL